MPRSRSALLTCPRKSPLSGFFLPKLNIVDWLMTVSQEFRRDRQPAKYSVGMRQRNCYKNHVHRAATTSGCQRKLLQCVPKGPSHTIPTNTQYRNEAHVAQEDDGLTRIQGAKVIDSRANEERRLGWKWRVHNYTFLHDVCRLKLGRHAWWFTKGSANSFHRSPRGLH